MANLGSAYISLYPSLDGFEERVQSALSGIDVSGAANKLGDELGNGIGKGFDKAGSSASGFSGRLSALTGVVAGVASNIAGRLLDSVAALGSQMVEAADSSQKFASTLDFAGVDDSTIKQLTASTQEYADRTVYDLATVRNVTAQLAANGVKDYAQIAEAAGNLNAVAGGNASTFESVGMVMTQTAGSGKLLTENWNQLTDAIPGASGALQEAMRNAGAFEGNFREAMESGEISADEFFAAVQQLGMQDVAVEAATSTSTIEGAVGNLQASVVGVGSQLVQAFTPFITGTMGQVSGVITGIGTALSTAGGYLSNWDGKLAEMSQEMGATATNGDLVALMVQDIAGQFGIGVEQSAGFADAIAGIVDAFAPLGTAFTNMATVVGPLFSTFLGSLGGLFVSLSPAVSMVASLVSSLMTTLANIATSIAATLLPILTQVIAFISETIIPIVMPAIQSIMTAVQTAMPLIQTAITTALGVIQGIWNFVWPAIQAVLEVVFSAISNVVQTVMGVINTVITAVMQAISGDWEGAWNTISSFLSGIWDTMKGTVSGAIDGVVKFFSDLPGNIMSALGNMGSLLVSAGEDLVQGFVDGIGNLAGAVTDAIGGLVNDAIDFGKSLLGIASPSKVFREIGEYTMEGMALGIEDGGSGVVSAMRGAMSDITDIGATRSGMTVASASSYAPPAIAGSKGEDLAALLARLHDDLMAIYSVIPEGVSERDAARFVRRYA